MGTTLDVHLFDTPEIGRRVDHAGEAAEPVPVAGLAERAGDCQRMATRESGRVDRDQSGRPYRKVSETSNASHTAAQTIFGSSPAANASSAVNPPSAENT